MKSNKIDINFLLICLLLFSISGGMFYTSEGTTSPTNSTHRSWLSIEDGLSLINPFIMSISIEKIIDLIKQFPPDVSYNIVKRVVEDKQSALEARDKQKLIFGLAEAFSENTKVQSQFFELLLFSEDIPKNPLIIINAANDNYISIIPALIKWAQTKKSQYPGLSDLAIKSLYKAIDLDNPKALISILEQKIPITAQQATDLLWHTISTNKNADFIQPLVKHGANPSVSKEGHTLVTKATGFNNQTVIKTLIDTLKKQGKTEKEIIEYINRFVDPAVGSPIQIAIQKGYIPLEIYLRKQGALER